MKTIPVYGILCGSLLISLFLSCEKADKDELTSFEISTSGCYKTCPILDAKFNNGTVYYNLIEYNKKEGVYKYKLTPKEISELNQLMSNVYLDSLKKEYASNIPDVQIYNTSFTYKGEKRNVFFFENESLESYQTLVKTLISFKQKKITKIDTILNVETRKRIPFEKMEIPPIPKDPGASLSK